MYINKGYFPVRSLSFAGGAKRSVAASAQRRCHVLSPGPRLWQTNGTNGEVMAVYMVVYNDYINGSIYGCNIIRTIMMIYSCIYGYIWLIYSYIW